MKIEHVALNVPEPVQAAQWYAANLGMEIIKSSDQDPFIHFLADGTRQGVIEMYNNSQAPIPDYASMSPFLLHIAFSVDDIETKHAALLAAGGTAHGQIETNEVGDRLAIVRDPWGVCIQLVQRKQPLL